MSSCRQLPGPLLGFPAQNPGAQGPAGELIGVALITLILQEQQAKFGKAQKLARADRLPSSSPCF